MIYLQDYEYALIDLGKEYFVETLHYVDDLALWAKEQGVDLSEPAQPMKLISEGEKRLTMAIQSEMSKEMMDNVLRGLSIRWALKNTASDPEKVLSSTKKQLAFCFLKEYSRTVSGVGGDEMLEDEWAIEEMKKLGFFDE